MSKQTDNSNIDAKMALRRMFLSKYHSESGSVFDACQGSGVMWSLLRSEFPHLEYWGVDVKKKKGRLSIDSSRILAQPGLPNDIIDIDTYGSPWKHWFLLLPNVKRPITVFLTIGFIRAAGGGKMSNEERFALGLTSIAPKTPDSLLAKLHDMSIRYCLTNAVQYGILIVEAWEAVSLGNARYIGIRLEPKLCE
jgi:hypothetical protein